MSGRDVIAVPLAHGTDVRLPDNQPLRAGSDAVPEVERQAGDADQFGPSEHRQLPRPLQSSGRPVLRAHRSTRSAARAPQFQLFSSLHDSPLRTAAADAERMAEKLANDPEVRRLGQPVYVYHDRTSSQVFIGSFNSEKDPAAIATREQLLKLAVPLMDKKRQGGGLDTMIVPATP